MGGGNWERVEETLGRGGGERRAGRREGREEVEERGGQAGDRAGRRCRLEEHSECGDDMHVSRHIRLMMFLALKPDLYSCVKCCT